MSSLRLVEITLAGFALYEEPTRFRFPEGSAIFYGKNESGKTTLLWGLAATWFGLPSTNDSTRPGTARFRSLSRPAEFWGEVVWENERRTFRLRRDFETHRVRFVEGTESTGLAVLFEGEHNPQGRSSAGSAFVPLLQEHLGIADLTLFLETFCLTAPFPDVDRIDAELQHLVTGGRAERADDVQDRLFERVKSLTKRTGDHGLTRPGGSRPANQREDGRIEELESAISRKKLDLEHARQRLDHWQENGGEILQLESELEKTEERRLRRERRLRAFSVWAEENRERVRRAEQLDAARRVLRTHDEIVAEKLALDGERETDLDPVVVEPLLAEFERTMIQTERLRDQGARVATQRAQLDLEIARAEGELEPLSKYGGRTDWGETLIRLRAARHRRSELETAARQLQSKLTDLPAAHRNATAGFEAIRAAANAVVSSISRLEAIEARIAAIQGQLESRAYLLEGDRLNILKQKLEIEAELRECSTLLRERTSALSQFEVVRARRQSFTVRQAQRRPSRSPIGLLLFGGGTLAIGIALATLTGSAWIALGGAIAVLGVALGSHRAIRGTWLPQSRGRTSGPMPDAAAITEPELKRSLESAETDVALLRERRQILDDRIEKSNRVLGPYASSNATELAALEARWQMLEQEREALTAELAERSAELGLTGVPWRTIPCSHHAFGVLAPAVALLLPWAYEAAALPPETTLFSLAGWLGQLTERDWDTWAARERALAQVGEERGAVEERLRSIQASLSDDVEIASIDALTQRLHPFTTEHDPETLDREARRALELSQRIAVLKEKRAEAGSESEEDFESELSASWNRLHAAWPNVAAQIPAPDERTAWLTHTRLRVRAQHDRNARIAGLEISATRLLESEGATSRGDIERRVTEHDSALGSLVRSLDRLEQEQLLASGLPTDAHLRATRLAEIAAEEERAESTDKVRIDEIRKTLLELERRRAGIEGLDILNVAQLEIEIVEARTELEEREREVESLILAYRWLQEATQTYQVSHRERLQQRITTYFGQLTGRTGRRIELDEKFHVTVRDESGRSLAPEQLSQGTRDPLVLAVRLGLADLLTGLPLPLLLDDPFVHCDADRLAHIRAALDRLGTQRPWLLLTHRRELADWADPVFAEALGAPKADAVPVRGR